MSTFHELANFCYWQGFGSGLIVGWMSGFLLYAGWALWPRKS
jgi:hypothetical protein